MSGFSSPEFLLIVVLALVVLGPKRLPEIAKFHGCDLIAMATHGRKGLQHLLHGSVTEKVMHRTDMAMLIFNPNLQELA